MDLAIVSLAFGASLAYVWRYYQRRLQRGEKATGGASQRKRGCPTACSGCPRD
jgi:hypothetical protein